MTGRIWIGQSAMGCNEGVRYSRRRHTSSRPSKPVVVPRVCAMPSDPRIEIRSLMVSRRVCIWAITKFQGDIKGVTTTALEEGRTRSEYTLGAVSLLFTGRAECHLLNRRTLIYRDAMTNIGLVWRFPIVLPRYVSWRYRVTVPLGYSCL